METITSAYEEALLMKRLNRFVAEVKMGEKLLKVHVPNTGRMGELAVPGSKVVLVPSRGIYRYKIMFIYYRDYPVMIDSIYSNRLAGRMLADKMFPGLEDYRVVKSEPRYGSHRFDYTLSGPGGRDLFLELKSCTLAWKNVSAFPDAVSERASRHLEKLGETGSGMALFLIMHRGVDLFIPNYHTDFAFYESMRKAEGTIAIKAFSLDFGGDFRVRSVKEAAVRVPLMKPLGSYLMVLQCRDDLRIDVGGLGGIRFRPGYYIYAGSGRNNVFKRIEHHRRKGGARHWHLDYVKQAMIIRGDLPFVTGAITECDLGRFMEGLSGEPVPGFGSTDCRCLGHFFSFRENPMDRIDFWDLVLKLRFDDWTGNREPGHVTADP